MLLAMLPNLSVSASAALRCPLLRCRGQPTSATRRRRAMISAVRVGQAAGSERRRAYGSVLSSAPARSTLSACARYAVDAGSAAGRLLEYDVRFSLRPCQSGKHGKRSGKQLRRSDGRGELRSIDTAAARHTTRSAAGVEKIDRLGRFDQIRPLS